MGKPFFSTFVDDYLFRRNNPAESISLIKKNVIIDGFSFFYYIYYEAQREDQEKQMIERVTSTSFPYDSFSEKFRDALKALKEKCASIWVVFDGIPEQNKHRRPDPERESSIKFHSGRTNLPPLLYDELISILRYLKIDVLTAPGVADPTVVQMARERNAYIVARDSDYYLYELEQGYVPLSTLDLTTLQGNSYKMTDVFHRMTQRGVALWATTIDCDFISFDKLQEKFPMKNAFDEKSFRQWMKSMNSDDDKRQRLTCQFTLLRYIQGEGAIKACDEVIALVSEGHSEFRTIMESYIEIPTPIVRLTKNGNPTPAYLNELYKNGELDRGVIDILVRREVLHHCRSEHSVHWNLLLPMCHMLLEWDQSTSNHPMHSSTVTFNGQTYNPLEFAQSDSFPSFENFLEYNEKQKKAFVLGCVDFGLKPQTPVDWHGVHGDYKIWFSMLKLWWHTKPTHAQSILVALIISFLKHILLDTYDEKEERSRVDEQFPEKPYRQFSYRKLKTYYSLKECRRLRKSIQNGEIFLSNDAIDQGLKECEQFYKELSMINQFSGQPLEMPLPSFCFSRLTPRLAAHLSQSKDMWKYVKKICSGNLVLFEFVKEFYEFISGEIISPNTQ